jgi:putative DNA primase/helicase
VYERHIGREKPAKPKELQTGANGGVTEKIDDPLHPDAARCTDLGNARRLVAAHGDDIRYIHAWKKWMVWNGNHWQMDEDGAVNRLARKVATSILKEAVEVSDKKARDALIGWALTSESRDRLAAMVTLAQDEEGIGVSHNKLDQQKMHLVAKNGTIDLETGQRITSRREHCATKALDIEYDPAAECPTWERFILEIMDGDKEMARYLQKCVGYTLTGLTTEQCMFFLFGAGKNGKTLLVEVLRELLKPFWMKIPAESLMAKRNGDGGIPNDIARLPGVRMAVSQETEEGRRWNEAKVKDLAGGDTLTARFMRAEWFDFEPTHKLWMYGNHKPQIKGTDDGIWRRLRVIPFNRQFLGPDDRGYNPNDPNQARPDLNLKEKLFAELSGILTWAVCGCLMWQAEGLESPQKVKDANRAYREEMDIIGLCLQERFIQQIGVSIPLARAYTIFDNWREQAGLEDDMNKLKFSNALRERGFNVKPGTGNITTVYGLGELDEHHVGSR